MKIGREVLGDTAVLRFRGKMTIGAGDIRLRNAVRDELDNGFRKIVLDLSGLSAIDSSGMGELVSAFTAASNRGATIVIAGVLDKFPGKDFGLPDIFAINQLGGIFDTYPSAEQAVSALQGSRS